MQRCIQQPRVWLRTLVLEKHTAATPLSAETADVVKLAFPALDTLYFSDDERGDAVDPTDLNGHFFEPLRGLTQVSRLLLNIT